MKRAAGICLGLVVALVGAAPATGQERPNIVVLMTDDQTLESMRVMPLTRDLIGERGTTFDRKIVNYSLCCPSRATLFTGQYSHNHGVLANTPPFGGYARLDRTNWLPVWLQSAGYRTMHVGKFLNGYGATGSTPTDVPPGWNDWHATVDPTTYRFYNYTVNENGVPRVYGANGEAEFYSTDFFARRANELINAAAPTPQPFFLSVAFLAPHSGGPAEPDDPQGLGTPAVAPRHVNALAGTPLPLPPSFNEADLSDKPLRIRNRPLLTNQRVAAITENYSQRLESLLAVDEAVASIVSTLDASGELDNTLILFTSDNGFFHGEHRIRVGKLFAYEPSVRLPLLMRGPGVPAGEHRRQLVTNADLAPTILDAANAAAGKPQDGRSLWGLLDDPGLEWGRELLLEGGDGNTGLQFVGLRNYRFKYIEHTTGERELYDLRVDPDELQSLHGDPAYAGIRDTLASHLAALRSCVGAGCRAKPKPRLRVRRRCSRRRFVAGVRSPYPLERVDFRLRRRGAESFRLLSRDARKPFRRTPRRPARRFTLRVRVALIDGRVVTVDKRVRRCR